MLPFTLSCSHLSAFLFCLPLLLIRAQVITLGLPQTIEDYLLILRSVCKLIGKGSLEKENQAGFLDLSHFVI